MNPSGSDRKIRVFISSTFKDMHAERDHLVTVVFPELRERIEQLGLEFFDVDLRWGVPKKDSDGEAANSWEYCRKWIDEVEPFFICLLGQRYGWVPPPENLKRVEDQQRQARDPRSVTDMEVRHGVLNSRLKRRSYFYLRETLVPAPSPDATEEQLKTYGTFVDPPPLSDKLAQLKAEVLQCGRPVRGYTCRWTGKEFADVDTAEKPFGPRVLEDLWSGVLRDERYVSKEIWCQVLGQNPDTDPRYTDESQPVPRELWEKIVALAKPAPKEPLASEREQMEAFAQARLRWFQGRTRELQQLTGFINSTDEKSPCLAVVAAVPGQGKSALLARLATLLSPPSTFLITHFVGATERSANAYNLVDRLLGELDRSGIPWPSDQPEAGQEPKRDFNSLCLRLAQRLGDYAGDRRIVILLDALNQLSDGHDLHWLPHRLGPSVRVIVSCVDDSSSRPGSHPLPSDRPTNQPRSSRRLSRQSLRATADKEAHSSPPEKGQSLTPTPTVQESSQLVLRALTARQPAPLLLPLGELTPEDVRTIVVAYLKEYCHELDREHLDTLCAVEQAHNPLYLMVMLNELRTLGGNNLNNLVPTLIASLPQNHPDTVSLFRWVLQRLEDAEGFGKDAVQWWCLYLAHGRAGMASHELSDLLARKLGPDAAKTALRIERALRRYLQRRGPQLDFFHAQLREAVFEECRPQAEAVTVHSDIAAYFRDLADPEKNQSWKGDNPRPFLDLAFHWIHARLADELCLNLCALRFVEARFRLGQVFDLQADYALVQDAIARGEISTEVRSRLCEWQDFVSHSTHKLIRKIEPLLQIAYNYANGGAVAKAAQDETAKYFMPWLRLLNRPNLVMKAACQRILEGQGGWILALAVTNDGRWAVAGGGSRSQRTALNVWDIQTGNRLNSLDRHTGWVHCLCLSPDNQVLVSGGFDGMLCFWDLASQKCLHAISAHNETVSAVCVMPDGQRAASGGFDNNVRIWDLSSGRCLRVLSGHEMPVSALVGLPDGRHLMSGSFDKTIRIWDLHSGNCVQGWSAHSHYVMGLAVSADGRTAISAGRDKAILVWDLAEKQCRRRLTGHTKDILSVAMTSDGRLAASGGEDRTVRIWDVENGRCIHVLEGHGLMVYGVSLFDAGRLALSGGIDETLRLWNLQASPSPEFPCKHTKEVERILTTTHSNRVVSCGDDDLMKIWDSKTGGCRESIKTSIEPVFPVAIAPQSNAIVSGSMGQIVGRMRLMGGLDSGIVTIWEIETGKPSKLLRGHKMPVASVAVSLLEDRIASGGFGGELHLWDFRTGECLRSLEGHKETVRLLAFSRDGTKLVSATANETLGSDGPSELKIWDVERGQWLFDLSGHKGRVQVLAITPDGNRVISGARANDCSVRVWDLRTGYCLHTFSEHRASVWSLAISQDGALALSGDLSGKVCLRHLHPPRLIRAWQAHAQDVGVVAFSPDSRRILTCSVDNTARIWNLDPWREIAAFQASDWIKAGGFCGNGSHCAIGDSSGHVYLLVLDNLLS